MSTANGFVSVSVGQPISQKDGAFPRALRFGTGGIAVIEGLDGTTATFTNIADGETLQVAARKIVSGTGVADIVGLFAV